MGKSVRIEQYILTRIYLNNIYNLPYLYMSKIQTPNDSLRNCIIPWHRSEPHTYVLKKSPLHVEPM